MKIEMGESLAASWLKHVRGCTMVQTNWKPSPRWQENHFEEIETLVQAAKQHFGTVNVFKQNAGAAQILHQMECDVIGFQKEGEADRWYAVEVAFHENGVNYGGKYKTAAKIAAKLFRSAIGLYCYMNVRDGEISFATPKADESYRQQILPAVEMVSQFFNQNDFGYSFRFLSDAEFSHEILNPVLGLVDEVSDTAELFLRAVQLNAMFSESMNIGQEVLLGNPLAAGGNTGANFQVNGEHDGEIKVGRLAQTVMRDILEDMEDPAELADLLDLGCSHEAFGLNYPVLVPIAGQFDHERYYSAPLTICGSEYRLCNQWRPRNRASLEAWIAAHEPNED